MFTGLIQQVGKLAAKKEADGSLRLIIRTQGWNPPLSKGESIAVNGVCLTVAQVTNQGFDCDVLEETVRCSNLNAKQTGAPLNLERAVRLGEPLGGHLITGHVEGLGTLIRKMNAGRDWRLDFSCDISLLRLIVPKGSVACDGISLTVASLTDFSFSVNIIPFTWANTNLHLLPEGETVNLETDLIGKYVFRRLEQNQRSEVRDQKSEENPARPITEDILRQAGFME